jgi:hypothetical protein
LVLTATTTGNSGTYEVTITNAYGTTNSSATLSVLPAPQFIDFATADGGINNGLKIHIIGGTNTGQYNFLWTTNLLTPISNWNNAGTLTVGTQGGAVFTLPTNDYDPSSPQGFFLLQLQ